MTLSCSNEAGENKGAVGSTEIETDEELENGDERAVVHNPANVLIPYNAHTHGVMV